MASTLDPVAGQVVTAAYLRAWMANWAPLSVVKIGNTSRASVTAHADDPELQLAVAANTSYMVESLMIYDAGLGLISLGLTIPAGATSSFTPEGLDVAVTASTTGAQRRAIGGAGIGSGGAGVATAADPRAIVTVGATPGTVAINWAQNTSNATATILKAGSWLKLTPIPI